MELTNTLYAILFILAGLVMYGIVCVLAILYTTIFLVPSIYGELIFRYNKRHKLP